MKTREVARRILDALERHHPDADTELVYRTPFELLVATMLSAQSTDAAREPGHAGAVCAVSRTRERSPPRSPRTSSRSFTSTGFFRQKSKAIIGMARRWSSDHGGEVPADMDALVALPGVGRKTANVVLGHALGVPGLPVDRHVLRVANRLGLVHSDDPVKVEAELVRAAAARALDPGLRHADPARPPHLPADAAVRALQRAEGLRLLSARAALASAASRREAAGHGQTRPDAARSATPR